jgi:hypothetical protein
MCHVYLDWSKTDMTNKVDKLRQAGFRIYWLAFNDITEIRDKEYVSPYWLSDHANTTDIPYVDLDSVASGEDTANQTSTWSRSNYRRLSEDYKNYWIDTSYSNVNALGAIVSDLPDEVIDVLIGLKTEYPIYDEEDVSQLENDEIDASWDQYHKFDISSAIVEKLSQDGKDDIADKFYEMTDSDIRSLFLRCVVETGNYPEHNGLEITWPDSHEVVNRMIAGAIRDAYSECNENHDNGGITALRAFASILSSRLQSDNWRFDREKFWKAAIGE